MKKGHVIALITAGLLLITFTFAAAGGRMHRGDHQGMPGTPAQFFKIHASDLDLSDKQLTNIEQICAPVEKETIQLRADIQILRTDIQAEMDKEKPDRAKVFALIDDVSKLESQLHKSHITVRLDINEILTPEQQEKVKTFHQKRRMREKGKMRGSCQQRGSSL
ncbi:Spy/CpxP family protein refolding chaperone [candidate division CSSED10-310 bacterium]|uniref:Spy/CpxP family protein refolding chaperone n=1 Tax=candidate division CSSED10-310 bacterium TaxID=2855610 RepID=A0ABV6YRE7_UNCC1